jgi:hypothetical protein
MRAGDRRYRSAVVDLARKRGDVVIRASAAFLHAPAPAFAGIMKARGAVVGNAGPAEFIRWLGEAPEDEILQVTELLRARGQEWRDGALAPNPLMLDLQRFRDLDEQARRAEEKLRAQSSEFGHMKLGSGMQEEVLKIAGEIALEIEAKGEKPIGPWGLSLDIAHRLGKKATGTFTGFSARPDIPQPDGLLCQKGAFCTLRPWKLYLFSHPPRHTEALR